MKLQEARLIAEEVKGWLAPYCKKIEIAGSIRRQKAECGDAELLCIPREEPLQGGAWETPLMDMCSVKLRELIAHHYLDYRLSSNGRKVYGYKNKLLVHVASSFPIDIFSTDEECWATAFVVRTGGKQNNIKIAMKAKKKGWRFNAYGSGFTMRDGTKIVCRTEREVFEAVGLQYKEPAER